MVIDVPELVVAQMPRHVAASSGLVRPSGWRRALLLKMLRLSCLSLGVLALRLTARCDPEICEVESIATQTGRKQFFGEVVYWEGENVAVSVVRETR